MSTAPLILSGILLLPNPSKSKASLVKLSAIPNALDLRLLVFLPSSEVAPASTLPMFNPPASVLNLVGFPSNVPSANAVGLERAAIRPTFGFLTKPNVSPIKRLVKAVGPDCAEIIKSFFSKTHKTFLLNSNWVDIKNKRCKGQGGNCETRVNRRYKGYCSFCFQHMFPKDPLTFQIRSKTKEIAVRDFINEHFEGFYHDKTLYTGHCNCTHRRRIDHRKLINGTILAIETDENQHKSYDKMDEEMRYDDLYMIHSGKWVYIRFNPDKYKNHKGVSKNPKIASRLTKLKKEIEFQIERIKNNKNTELVERVYMYYDGSK